MDPPPTISPHTRLFPTREIDRTRKLAGDGHVRMLGIASERAAPVRFRCDVGKRAIPEAMDHPGPKHSLRRSPPPPVGNFGPNSAHGIRTRHGPTGRSKARKVDTGCPVRDPGFAARRLRFLQNDPTFSLAFVTPGFVPHPSFWHPTSNLIEEGRPVQSEVLGPLGPTDPAHCQAAWETANSRAPANYLSGSPGSREARYRCLTD